MSNYKEPRLLDIKKFNDERGFFSETWNKDAFAAIGIEECFVQDNHSFSKRKGTLRGLHFQNPPFAQAKLIRCLNGSIFDVAVDIRKESKNFGKVYSAFLEKNDSKQFYIPEGFAHGFLSLSDNTEITYKCSKSYSSDSESSIRYDDPVLNIEWPIKDNLILSTKDREAPFLSESNNLF